MPSVTIPDVRPDWRELPSAEDMAAVYPAKALAEGLGGKATIDCKVTVDGDLADCKVLSEAPAGYGFGDAALQASATFKMEPALHDGARRESSAKIPIVFKPPPEPAASTAACPERKPLTTADLLAVSTGLLIAALVGAVLLGGLYWLIGRRTRD